MAKPKPIDPDYGKIWDAATEHLKLVEFVNSHEHVYVCQDCSLTQEEVNDMKPSDPTPELRPSKSPN